MQNSVLLESVKKGVDKKTHATVYPEQIFEKEMPLICEFFKNMSPQSEDQVKLAQTSIIFFLLLVSGKDLNEVIQAFSDDGLSEELLMIVKKALALTASNKSQAISDINQFFKTQVK